MTPLEAQTIGRRLEMYKELNERLDEIHKQIIQCSDTERTFLYVEGAGIIGLTIANRDKLVELVLNDLRQQKVAYEQQIAAL